MTGFLVSVRNAVEAAAAVAAGVDLVDVKEPRRGSLGPADGATVRQVVATAARAVPVSIALGELTELHLPLAAELCLDVQFAKLGLAGCADLPDWRVRWARVLDTLPPHVGRVAVFYVDWPLAGAPQPAAVFEAAAALGCRAALVDTFDKRAGGLLEHWSLDQIQRWIADAHSLDMQTVVAGSLTPASLTHVLPLAPDYVAVRGAACHAARTGAICRDRLDELVSLVRRFNERLPNDLPAAAANKTDLA
jgi:(5-formylfuran-3-yl)methyl phosphate synthase